MVTTDKDYLSIGGQAFISRLLIGTGKYPSDALIPNIIESSGAQIITVALRRVDFDTDTDNVMKHIPEHMQLLPNTSGARTSAEAVRIARLAKAAGCGNWIKIETIPDNVYLLPDGHETILATEILAKEGFIVLPYIQADLVVARQLVDAGASAVMPLGAPIGTNKGLKTKDMLQMIIDEIDLPVIVDAGIGKPSHACAPSFTSSRGANTSSIYATGRRVTSRARLAWSRPSETRSASNLVKPPRMGN
ncbi:MAG: thiazole synthase [Desulfobacterales bacterium]